MIIIPYFSDKSSKFLKQTHHFLRYMYYYCLKLKGNIFQCYLLYPRSTGGGGGILFFYLCPSFRPSTIFFVAFFSVTIDGRNLIFGHKLHIGIYKHVYAIFTVVKELRSKMFGQHPGYFKAVFLKQTRIIIVSIYKYTVYKMF